MNKQDEDKAKEIASSLWSGDEMNGDLIRGIATISAIQMAAWKEHQMIEKLKEMEIEDGDIEDFANEEQSSNYGLSEKFISRLKKAMEE